MKAIIRAEQFLRKPFTGIDYSDPEELLGLLYCVVLVNNDIRFTFEEFRLLAENDKQLRAMGAEMEKYNAVLAQFIIPGEDKGSCGGNPQYLGDLVSMLVMSGMDASYVMNDMELSDLPLFLKAYENRKKEEMESRRLWTFLTVSPHIDTRKIDSVESFFPFPWEVEATRETASVAIERDREMFDKFINEGKDLFKSN